MANGYNVMNKRVYLCLAHTTSKELEYIHDAFENNWVVPLGPNVDAFERALEDYVGGASKVVALSSGTAAIHLALVALGVERGDEVIVQDFTFCASANPVVYQGAHPVFVDSERDTWNLDPDLLEQAVEDRIKQTGRKPKAIIPVTLYGMPYQVDRIMEIAIHYDIPVIEDSAEGLGSMYKGRMMGTFGRFGIMSFNGNKMITTSGGGALICNPGGPVPPEEMKRRIMYLSTQARQPELYYHHTEVGYNYRMSNICAGIGRGQMEVLHDHVSHHRHVHSLYCELLKGVEGVRVMCEPQHDIKSNYWLTTVEFDRLSPKDVLQRLDAADIESRLLWKPMHMQPVFADCAAYISGVSHSLFNRGLCLPSGPMVTDSDVNRITEIIKQMLYE